jgi:hypothetical protein
MNRRLLAALLGAGAAAAALWFYLRPHAVPTPPPVVPIADGKAIDFSTGKAVVRSTAADKQAMDAALKEMDEATKNVTFQADPPKK